MNTSSSPVIAYASKLNRFAHANPTRTLLVAIGCGLAVGVLVRALQPRISGSRAAHLLADVQDRLHGIAAPIQRQVDHMVERGVSTTRNGAAHFHDLHLDRGFRKLGRQFKNLFR